MRVLLEVTPPRVVMYKRDDVTAERRDGERALET
jgi:hypothetical protein